MGLVPCLYFLIALVPILGNTALRLRERHLVCANEPMESVLKLVFCLIARCAGTIGGLRPNIFEIVAPADFQRD